MVRITYCTHCDCWSAVFVCPKCKVSTRCSEISDIWSDNEGLVSSDDFPLVECGDCGYYAEVGDIVFDSADEVRFSIDCATDS